MNYAAVLKYPSVGYRLGLFAEPVKSTTPPPNNSCTWGVPHHPLKYIIRRCSLLRGSMTEDPRIHYLSRNVPRKTSVLGFLLGPSEQGEMYFEQPNIDPTPPSQYVRLGRCGTILHPKGLCPAEP